ncbi:hypothetical protein [Streptosporangium sp. NBC_01469]|uniref:hypothetical protein n=1 Tax=Streptosporangium sp. NBC_01469 TaxID=2903898 RepID=UPI002E2CB758|nr:hypothetical protein [Streptosporangium sp. NBC_01469]
MALTALPLAARRHYPLVTFWVVLAAALATHAGATWITVLTCAVAAYGALAHSRSRFLAMGGLVLAAALAGAAFMVVQAGAARKVMDAEPEQSKQALLAIESGGRRVRNDRS